MAAASGQWVGVGGVSLAVLAVAALVVAFVYARRVRNSLARERESLDRVRDELANAHAKPPDDTAPVTARDEWLRAFFSSPAGHRQNAQNAYTVAAAVAGAIVTAGALVGVQSVWWPLQATVGVVLALWLGAAWWFMQAVGTQPPSMKPSPLAGNQELFVAKAMERTWSERDTIAKKGGAARDWTSAAIVATVAALIFWIFAADFGWGEHWGQDEAVLGTVALSRGGAAAILAVCDAAKLETTSPPGVVPRGAKVRETTSTTARQTDTPRVNRSTNVAPTGAKERRTTSTTSVPTAGVKAKVRPSTLDDETVPVKFDKGKCQQDAATVRLRQAQIRAFQTKD